MDVSGSEYGRYRAESLTDGGIVILGGCWVLLRKRGTCELAAKMYGELYGKN